MPYVMGAIQGRSLARIPCPDPLPGSLGADPLALIRDARSLKWGTEGDGLCQNHPNSVTSLILPVRFAWQH
ncbi:hypothetical protein CHELA1G2_11754 [Hyphomicrobiales bacterium]|nr:hypothetical protein CHELA1G2_11754 [Hyphomicrobiales bacterium]